LKSQLFGKEPDDGKDRRQKEKKWQMQRQVGVREYIVIEEL